jgi:Zn-dependent peptidase ImmA (M78 family)
MLTSQEIDKKVSELLKRNKVERPPVPVDRIAESLGIDVNFAPASDGLSGALIRNEEGFVIGVNSDHHQNRQRFTIAHELGHFLFHEGIKLHVDDDFRVNFRDHRSSSAVDVEEIEANRFAAAMLMPVVFLMRDAGKARIKIDKAFIQKLAEKYVVSFRAMELRLVNIGLVSPF